MGRVMLKNLVATALCSSVLALCSTTADAAEDIQPWNGGAVSDWTNATKATVITDMTMAEPSTAFSAKPKKGHWMTIPYEMRPDSGGHKGKAIWCGYEADPPEIKIRTGRQRLACDFRGIPCGAGLWLKLDQDKAPLWRRTTSMTTTSIRSTHFSKLPN